MTALDEINKIAHKLPIEVMQDIDKRTGDWLAMGGKHDDPYIQQQLRYMDRHKNHGGLKMLNIIVWTAIAIINWFNPNLDVFPKLMFTLAALTISVQAIHIKLITGGRK